MFNVVPARVWLICAALFITSPANAVLIADFGLGPAAGSGSIAELDVSLTFTPNFGTSQEVVFFGIDVSGSDGALSAGGTDFSNFAFDLAAPLVADWTQLPFTGFGPLSSVIEFDTFTSSIVNGPVLLGILSVDFGGLGILPGTQVSVSINSLDTFVGYEDPPGNFASFDFADGSFPDGGSQAFTIPEPSQVPEPPVVYLLVFGFIGLAVLACRKDHRKRLMAT